ncbi:unnamed protein product [Brugia timori]|uniref:Helicase C-terminal domain-containing protein n=1 Tax=Brugia timori TaxID=42155 RepID=A0A0R3QE57_9BILA|nr:unnamed protein product [Brugia timori]
MAILSDIMNKESKSTPTDNYKGNAWRNNSQEDCKTIIFVETKRKADDLTRWMRRDGWPALCIHGDKGQSERDWALSEFRSGKTPILLATDVAARGLGKLLYLRRFESIMLVMGLMYATGLHQEY